MGCVQAKSKKKSSQKNTSKNLQYIDNDVKNCNKPDSSSQGEVTRNTTAIGGRFPDRAMIPSLENKQVVLLKDHFLKQNVQVPVLQPVEQSSLIAHRQSIHKQRTDSDSIYVDLKKSNQQKCIQES